MDPFVEKGGHFIEAPVSGSKGPAESGTLIFLCGGDKATYDQCGEALDAMGKAKYLFGPVGKGSEVKLIVNMIMGTMMTAFAEGVCFLFEVGYVYDVMSLSYVR